MAAGKPRAVVEIQRVRLEAVEHGCVTQRELFPQTPNSGLTGAAENRQQLFVATHMVARECGREQIEHAQLDCADHVGGQVLIARLRNEFSEFVYQHKGLFKILPRMPGCECVGWVAAVKAATHRDEWMGGSA